VRAAHSQAGRGRGAGRRAYDRGGYGQAWRTLHASI
jgi:hypothetical protein